MLEMVKELWDVTFVMDKGHILGTYPRESVGDEDLEDLFFQVTGQAEDRQVDGSAAEDRQVDGGAAENRQAYRKAEEDLDAGSVQKGGR